MNFCKFSRNFIESLDHDYDCASIMYYSSRTFSRNGKHMIKLVKPGTAFGTCAQFSPKDIQKPTKCTNALKVRRVTLKAGCQCNYDIML